MKTLVFSFPGDSDVDERDIIKAVKREENGAGFSFVTGRRDISFSFVKDFAIKAAIKRVKMLMIRGLKCDIYEEE
jgi:hypothetical protein